MDDYLCFYFEFERIVAINGAESLDLWGTHVVGNKGFG